MLPSLMVAPNGASKTRADHPALPVTLDEVTEAARACRAAGADGLHLHLRDGGGGHLLDTGAYREALTHLGEALPDMPVQITTEAAGRYGPGHQKFVALNSGGTLVSAAWREITGEPGATAFYEQAADAGIAVQHILYDVSDAEGLAQTLPKSLLRDSRLQLIFVLGRYVDGQVSTPDMLHPFTDWMRATDINPDWMLCAFGQGETACLAEAHRAGGKCRVGFENSLVNADGTTAPDNAARVAEVRAALG
ncbi:3-keto-5-aminohexanoate cleavage protein [Maritimibacter sp. UBA3975]|uniref:3-keto-5-aminohexanoate cleavage protein n=1 Tax=Maritimibacter sp. UBA3975 TaxID=1946833 RepID=UPI0025BF22EF|nr:3-keto-5-aminohexanoate cleavage protein [Maritimibacter sp. UBA3975]|tara:strand:- start:1678 stop:2427 length:750 start_codon:yes stop_codon:yes gene_type:complete